MLPQFSQVSPQRAAAVIEDVVANSEPGPRFYALLITAAMIACFGLASNSTAVIIGAMLVSPLMTPIFGIALGMLRGDPVLLMRSSRAEAGGVLLAIGSAALIGASPLFSGEATPEMLARTQPNLLDLLVAIFAGFAGAYALVDERISPALPGVAIATAIVPPLSTCGMCLSLGAWSAAGGALLLFLANFVSILTVALAVFGIPGLGRSDGVSSRGSWFRRFGATVVVFLVMALILTQSLARIIADKRIERGLRDALVSEFAADLAVDLDDFVYHLHDGRVEVLVNVRAPRALMPARVTRLQAAATQAIGYPVDLVVRTTLAKDVSPLGSSLQVSRPDVSGSFLTRQADAAPSKERLAAQVIRESFEDSSGFELTNIEYGVGSNGRGIVLAYIDALSRLPRDEILELERRLRERLGDDQLTFAVRLNEAQIESSHGPFLVDWTNWARCTPAEYENLPTYAQEVRQVITAHTNVLPLNVHFRFESDLLHVLVEVAGPQLVTREEVKAVEGQLRETLQRPVRLSCWSRNELIVEADRYTTYDAIAKPGRAERSQALQQIFGVEGAKAPR